MVIFSKQKLFFLSMIIIIYSSKSGVDEGLTSCLGFFCCFKGNYCYNNL